MIHRTRSHQSAADSHQATAAFTQRPQNLTHVYTTLKHLEGCVGLCEALAVELAPNLEAHPLHEHLAECIVACEQYTGALVRQSLFCIQYAEVVVAACANLADLCVHADAPTALQCAESCGDAIDMIRADFAVTLLN